MAGRGRGSARGRGVSFAVENLGFGRGDALPTAVLAPPPNFPPLDLKPCPVLDIEGSPEDYIYQLSKEFKSSMQESAVFLQPREKLKDIQRYSDKYQISDQKWDIDMSNFPKELWPKPVRKRKLKTKLRPNVPKALKLAQSDSALPVTEDFEKEDSGEEDENTENPQTSVNKEKKEDDEDKNPGASDEEELDEDDLEEENDYIQNYFDNGEGYGNDDEDDNLDEGAVY